MKNNGYFFFVGSPANGLSDVVKEFSYKNLSFYVFKGVYEPGEDTFLLAENLDVRADDRVLDMGTGCGILAVLSALKASWVLAVDVNPNAVRCAKVNARRNGVLGKISFVCGDLFNPLRRNTVFDLVLFNAPYLPVEEKPREWIEYAWAGGKNGRRIIDRFLNDLPNYLRYGGRLLLVQSSLSNIEETLIMLENREFKTEIVDRKRFFFEEIALIKAVRH